MAWMDCECKAEQLADSEKKFEVQTDELIITKEHQAGWRKKQPYMKQNATKKMKTWCGMYTVTKKLHHTEE